MTKRRSKALWGLIPIGMLLAILVGGLSSYVRTANFTWVPSSATSAAAQATAMRPWTAVASTGTVDESSLGIFAFGPPLPGYPANVSTAGYLPGTASLAPITLRYNVTNTFDNNANPNQPGWQILELTSTAPQGTDVRATLYRVRPCTGEQERICTAINLNQPSPTNCVRCQFPTTLGPIDFGVYQYYVEVILRRSTPEPLTSPAAHGLRIY